MKRSIVPSTAPSLCCDSNRYTTNKGEISLIHPCRTTMGSYEIYCIHGNLFEDIERYSTLEEAEARIREFLGE